jgi:Na+/alanine symporter
MVLAQCHVYHKKFASEGDLVGAAAMVLFHKIAQMKKRILLLLLLIMATLIDSVDDIKSVKAFVVPMLMLQVFLIQFLLVLSIKMSDIESVIVNFRIQPIMADSKSATFNEMYLEGMNVGVEMPDSQKMSR